MVQKKICMVGAFATGKTSLVQQFVFSKFSEKYHSTVGVKIDRKEVDVGGTRVNLLLWDLAGQDRFQSVQATYLRGASAVFFVVDGTRRETLADLANLRTLIRETLGTVPALVAINKADLENQWEVTQDDFYSLLGEGCHVMKTSAKTGMGVNQGFHWLAGQALKG